jgi:PAS domain S-box-containing protein
MKIIKMNSPYAYTPQIWPSVITLLLLPALAAYAWRRRSVPGALPFAIGSLLAALWAGGSVLEYAALGLADKILWVKVQAVWQLPTITAITCFILEYARPGRWLTRRNLALLAIVPVLILGLILTNDRYHLMWAGFSFVGSVLPVRAAGARLAIGYGYALGLVNVAAYVWLFLRSPQHRWPVAIMLTGMLASRTVYFMEKAGFVQYNLPLDILAVGIMDVIFAIALFGFHLFDPIPLARRMAIEQLHDGLLVLDARGRVASLNPAALAILGGSKKSLLGQPIRDLLPVCPDLPGSLPAAGRGRVEIRLERGSQPRDYMLETSALKDWRQVEIGRLLLLQDVTEQKQAHAQIIKQQRALAMLQEREQLARELHDNLGQVFAFVSTQGQAIRRLLGRGDISTADEYTGRLVEVARAADADIRESIVGLRAALLEQGLFPALSQYLAQFEKNTAIHTELVRPAGLDDGCFDAPVQVQLVRILQEALTNVRKHACAHNVEIKFEAGNGWVNIIVRDDGHGFDPAGRTDGSGEHIGLRVMRERALEVGGSFSLQSEVGRGTQVLVRVPVLVPAGTPVQVPAGERRDG